MLTKGNLAGKTALVTGASSGLGAHFAGTLAKAGMRVALAARRMDELEQRAVALRLEGHDAITIELDVTSQDSIASCVSGAGPIDILVNNAGVTVAKPALEQTSEDYDRVLDVDLKGAFMMAREVARAMRDGGQPGSIINIASVLGLRQAGNVSTYAMAKAGVIQMTKSLALELARHRIRVNAIAPGYFATELNADFLASEAGTALVRRIPQRRVGEPSDLDGPLLLLASDASAYMTGAIIAVDGGHLCSSL